MYSGQDITNILSILLQSFYFLHHQLLASTTKHKATQHHTTHLNLQLFIIPSSLINSSLLSTGVGLITRKAANAVTPTVELRKEGDVYNLVTSSTFKTTEVKFKPGEEFDEDRADGAKVRRNCNEEIG